MSTYAPLEFANPALAAALESITPEDADHATWGLVGMEAGGRVVLYNTFEQQLSGLSPGDVIGKDFFTQVAPCTNNFMVRERFVEAWAAGTDLDEIVRYTFTYRMKPTRVDLRLIVRGQRGWLVVDTVKP